MRTIYGRSRDATEQWSHYSESTPAVFSMPQELLGYVFTDGFNHLAYLGSANHVLSDMMALQLDTQQYPDTWEVIYQMSRRHKALIPWPARKHDFMLYILTSFASDSLLHAFLGPSPRVVKPKYQTNPLIYAAHFGKPKHAQLLLSRGAQINERGFVVDASRQALPLEVAVSRQHDAMVDLLLSAGSLVPKRLFALSTYYYKFPVRIVRSLLETHQFVEWALEPGNKLPSPLRILEQRPPLVYETDIIFIIRRLVQVGVDYTEQDSAQRTALYFAIKGGYQAVVVYLLLLGTPFSPDFISIISSITSSERIPMLRLVVEAGVDVHSHIHSDDTTLHVAITLFQDDCLEVVKILVGAGCKPFVRDAAGKTPLHLALEKGNPSVADYLLSQGMPPSDALLAVVESRCPTIWRLEALRALVNGGADIHGITHHEDVLLHREMMSLEKHQGLEMAKVCGAGSDPSGRNSNGKTPLCLVMDRNSLLADYLHPTGRPPPPDALFAVLRSDLQTAWKALTICSLIGKGADVRGLSTDGNTLLYTTVLTLDERQGLDVAKLLVGAGCDPFRCTADGKTPLHIALDRNFPVIADYLLSTWKPIPPDALFAILHSALPVTWRAQTMCSLVGKGADVRGLSADGNTLLHVAGLVLDERRALYATRLLVDAGCDPSTRNRQGKTAIHIAVEKGSISVMEYILSLDQSLPDDILFSVLKSHDRQELMLEMLIAKGANTRVVAADGNNLLHTIFSLPYGFSADTMRAVVYILLQNGCDASAPNCRGKTPLHLAVSEGYAPIVKCLLSTTALPNSTLISRSRPTHSAITHLPADILACVLDRDVERTSWEGTRDMLELLIETGANIHVRAADGGTLLHIAIKNCQRLSTIPLHPTFLSEGAKEAATGFGYGDLLTDWLWPSSASQKSSLPSEVPGEYIDARAQRIVEDGVTLLDIIELLVDSGCDPSQCDADGHPPVYFAVLRGHVDVVEYLLPLFVPLAQDLWHAVDSAPWRVRNELRELMTGWESGV